MTRFSPARLALTFLLVLLVACLAACGGGESSTDQGQANTPPDSLPVRTVEIRTEVYPNAEAAEPLPVGEHVPAVTVNRVNGEPVNLATEVSDGATLVFYRGGW